VAGEYWLYCDYPLRGGVSLELSVGSCSYGFTGYYPEHGNVQYVVTAGHCIKGTATGESGTKWYSDNAEFSHWKIGPSWSWKIDSTGDYGLIKVSVSSNWSPVNPGYWVLDSRPGGLGYQNALENIVSGDMPGLYNCHTGESSKTVCGEVLSVHNSFCYKGGEGCPGDMTEDSASGIPGDSGGTVWGGDWAFGVFDAIAEGGSPSYYSELESILPNEGGLNISLVP
jgi:hypothetical protein